MTGLFEARAYMHDIRGKTLDVLERVELTPDERLLTHGYVYGMVVQHEHMHDETMLATIQLMKDRPYAPAVEAPRSSVTPLQDMVRVDGGPFEGGRIGVALGVRLDVPGDFVVGAGPMGEK